MSPTDASPSLADRAASAFRSYRSGDEAGLARLVEAVTPVLWNTARGLGLDPAAAEDVVQETWLALYQHAEQIDEAQAVLQWLLTTTRRRAWALAKRGQRAPLVADPGAPGRDQVAPASAQPDTLVLRSETEEVLWRHVGRLSTRCQVLLRVIALGDRPDYAAMATALGMPAGSIGPTRGRCLAKLRTALAADPLWTRAG